MASQNRSFHEVQRFHRASTTSLNSLDHSRISINVWISRILLFIILVLFVMPLALFLTPWWILMQPCQKKCFNMIDGYYRIVTWPLKLSRNIRSYQRNHHFVEKLKY